MTIGLMAMLQLGRDFNRVHYRNFFRILSLIRALTLNLNRSAFQNIADCS